jgi:hypothetical protein
MGVGPNYVLDKGMLVQGSAAVVQGTLYQQGTVDQSVTPHTAVNQRAFGVAQENVDAARVATGKVFADFRVLGIARVICGAAVTKGARVAPDAAGKAITWAAGATAAGVALSTTTAADQHLDVLLTPGMPPAV